MQQNQISFNEDQHSSKGGLMQVTKLVSKEIKI